MDLPTTLAEIVSLSVAERIRLVEAIWDSIAPEPGQPELTGAWQQELERRLAATHVQYRTLAEHTRWSSCHG